MRKDSNLKDKIGKLFIPLHYAARCKSFCNNNKRTEGGSILFIGDSITEGYPLKRYFFEYPTVNCGIAGDTTRGIVKRLNVCCDIPTPQAIVFLAGINDLGKLYSVQSIEENYERIFSFFNERHRGVPVFALSLLPVNKGAFGDLRIRTSKILELNCYLSAKEKQFGYKFVNLFPFFTEPESKYLNRKLSKDGLHPNADGYSIITDKIKELLNNL